MRAGKLRHKMTIEAPPTTRNAYNEATGSWTTFATVWGSIEPLSGRELVAARELQSDVDFKITIRYLSGVAAKMRVSWNSRTFDIAHVESRMEGNREMWLFAVERT